MNFIEHFGSFLAFALGTSIIQLKLTRTQIIVLLAIFGGLAIGMFNHVMIQDMWAYDHEEFQSLVINEDHREVYSIPFMWCMVQKNNQQYCLDYEHNRFDPNVE